MGGGQVDSGLVVLEHRGGSCLREADIGGVLAIEQDITGAAGKSNVLRLGRAKRDAGTFLGRAAKEGGAGAWEPYTDEVCGLAAAVGVAGVGGIRDGV